MNQLQTLMDAFDRGEALTVASALSTYGIYALSQRCGDLVRKFGYPVESETITTASGKHVSQYWRGGVAYG